MIINPNLNPEAHYSYLEMLAVQHKDLHHSEKEEHYFRGELEDFYLGFRDRVNYPSMVSESFENNYYKENGDAKKGREHSFIIVKDYAEKNDYKAIDEATSICEEIGEEIIRKILLDFEDIGYVLDYGGGILIENKEKKYVGMRFTMTFENCFNEEIDKNKWND
jgi:hypothetical protein